MTRYSSPSWLFAAALAAVVASSEAWAQEATLSDTSAPQPQSAGQDFPAAAPLSETDLDTMRGGQGVEVTLVQTLTAESVGNSVNADQVGSGSIALEGEAFSSFNGVANVVVNTGHNNTLQGSVSVNVIYNDLPATAVPAPQPPSAP